MQFSIDITKAAASPGGRVFYGYRLSYTDNGLTKEITYPPSGHLLTTAEMAKAAAERRAKAIGQSLVATYRYDV